jgi:hypothetical protein
MQLCFFGQDRSLELILDIIRNSINSYDARKWLEDCCRAEMILGMKPLDKDSKLPWEPWFPGVEYANGLFQDAYAVWQKNIKSPMAPIPTSTKKLGELLNNAGFEMKRTNAQKYRRLPNPEECLKKVLNLVEK